MTIDLVNLAIEKTDEFEGVLHVGYNDLVFSIVLEDYSVPSALAENCIRDTFFQRMAEIAPEQTEVNCWFNSSNDILWITYECWV
jgi:hypothetical protein